MKSKVTKIQKVLMKGIAAVATSVIFISPIAYATTSLDDNYLESSFLNQLLYGTIGSTVKEIEKYLKTETTLYIINETQLRAFAEYVNNGNNCAGKQIILLNDIELDKNNEWTPIGKNETVEFAGTFNGNNHTIYGIRYARSNKTYKELTYVGLFGEIHRSGIVKNLNVKDSKINLPYNEDDVKALENQIYNYNSVGILAGRNKGLITDCTITNSEIKGFYSVGGIAGTNHGKIENCISDVTVEGYGMIGGIAGQNHKNDPNTQGLINNCINKGRIVGNFSFIGGITGQNRAQAIVSNSVNEGPSISGVQYVGGISGITVNNAITKYSYNKGNVTGESNIGGISGITAENSKVENCINEASDVSGSRYVGRMVGSIDNRSKVIGSIDYSELSEGESGKIVNLSNASTILQSYKITNVLIKEDIDSIAIDNFDEVYQFDATQGKVIFNKRIGYSEAQSLITQEFGGSTVTYEISKNNQIIENDTYFKAGDMIKVTAKFDKYLAKTYGPLIAITEAPILKINNKIEMTAGAIKANASDYTTTIDYTYIVEDGVNAAITTLNLSKSGTIYAISGDDYATNHPTINVSSVSTTVSGMTIDTTKPTVNTKIYVENALETQRYTAGKEVIVEVTTSESIEGNYQLPEIQISFSKSGIGKYNYTEENDKVGYAKCKEARINLDGTTTWIYSYQVQEFDEGFIQIAYQTGNIVDVAGNKTNLKELYTASNPITPETTVSGSEWNNSLKVSYEFYKNSVSNANKIEANTYFTDFDDLIVVATYDKVLYVHYGLSDGKNTNIRLTSTYKDRAPSMYLNGDTRLKQSSILGISTTNYIESETKSGTTQITYKFNDIAKAYELKDLTQISSIVLKNENNTENVTINGTSVTTNGLIPIAEKWYSTYTTEQEKEYNTTTLTSEKINTTNDIQNIVIDPIGVSEKLEETTIYADTTAPTIEIIPVSINASTTNKDIVHYVFKVNEEIEGFSEESITVNNGTKGELLKKGDINGDGIITSNDYLLLVNYLNSEQSVYDVKYDVNLDGELNMADGDLLRDYFSGKIVFNEYIMNITPNVVNGNVGNLQVMIEQNACQDLVGHGNVRAESIIKIDKKAPILLNLEAYGTSNILLNQEIDAVKENYKLGETITVVATFDENITALEDKLPVLNLQFSESGNAKGTVSGRIEGNKIIYSYTITEGDEGILSVKGFTGTVVDSAGNQTKVTKRALDGDTIIADNMAPKLTGISVIAPDFEYDELLKDGENKRYGTISKSRDNNTITIITEYSENVYNLNENKINNIVSETVPVLQLRFGGTNAAGTVRIKEIIGNKISYEYDITSGDNGKLSIASLTGEVSDIAGNKSTISVLPNNISYYEVELKEENKIEEILADTNKVNITLEATAINKDDKDNQITGNGDSYRKGAVITITAKADEYVYKNTNNNLQKYEIANAPQLNINFETTGQGVGTCQNVEYKDNQTIFTYEYVIKENDNGKLTESIAEDLGYDIALNGNNNNTQSIDRIVADTIKPTYKDNNGDINYHNGQYIVTFNEPLYYLENNEVKAFGNSQKAPKLKFEGLTTEYTASVNGNAITYTGSYVNAKTYLSNSSLCDKAGNLYAYYDQEAPILSKIEVTTPVTGTYKAETEITIVATFSEKLTGTAPALQLQFNESGDAKGVVSTGIIENNIVTYKYIITAGDNGKLSIKSFTGTGLKDLSDNNWVAPEAAPELRGNTITADTIAPIVTITSDVQRTNKEVVTYTFKWSEPVYGFTAEDIEIANGSKGAFTGRDGDTTYTLTVDTTNEGRQIVKVASGVVRDIAGNVNDERSTYNEVVIDYTKPTIRAKVNGGNYVIGTDSQKSTLKETIVVNEEILKFEYIWSENTTMPTSGFEIINPEEIQVNSDINLEKQMNKTGTYYLYIRVTDLAGNTVNAKTKAFVVTNPDIILTPSITQPTNQDVTITVQYGEGLTENRKAGVSGKTNSADSTKVIVEENGTVYAEATDKAGNKVYKTLEVTNIDKTAPEATIQYTENNDGTVTAKISFNEENVTITNNNGKDAYLFSKNGEFTFEFKDAVENKGTAVAKVTTINEKVEPPVDEKDPEVVFEDLTVIQKNGTKYVKVSPTYTTDMLTAKMDEKALLDKKPEYTNLTSDKTLKTGTEIKVDGKTQYIVVVKGDVNCDGKVDFLGDIVMLNNYRIGLNKSLSTIQILAGDINNSGEIEFIPDIVAMNNYRLGKIKSL